MGCVNGLYITPIGEHKKACFSRILVEPRAGGAFFIKDSGNFKSDDTPPVEISTSVALRGNYIA
jgi:hypothetical protein